MDLFTAAMIAEGSIEPESAEQEIEAWQYLVDTGIVWQLQGWFGRTANDMINEGILTIGASGASHSHTKD